MIKFIFCLILLINACFSNKNYLITNSLENKSLAIIKEHTNVLYVAQEKNLPSFLKITQTKILQSQSDETIYHFKEDLLIQPTMNNANLQIELLINNKTKQVFTAENWLDPQTKETFLRAIVPYLKKDNQLVIKTSYNWMDVRDLPSLTCSYSLSNNCNIEVEIPYEVKLDYQSALAKKAITWQPQILETSQKNWKIINESNGQKFIFSSSTVNNEKSDLELILSFKEALFEQKHSYLNNWSLVSWFISQKIPKTATHESIKSAMEKIISKKDPWEDFTKTINFMKTIAIQPSYKNQKYQKIKPSYITLQENKGSELDIVILLKSLLNYINIKSTIAIAKNSQNDIENKFYSPVIFSHPILIIFLNNKVHYFDPHGDKMNLSKDILGQTALTIQDENGVLIKLPYEN